MARRGASEVTFHNLTITLKDIIQGGILYREGYYTGKDLTLTSPDMHWAFRLKLLYLHN